MRLGLARLDQQNIDSRIYQLLTEQIVSGVMEPGTRITEEQIAEELGVSRTPVREAMRRLAQDDLVELMPRKGVRVKQLGRSDAVELYEIRAELEALAARRAATRMTDRDIRTLENQAAKARTALADGNPEPAFEFDANLHRLILERSENRRLGKTLEMLNNLVSFFRREVGQEFSRATVAFEEHESLLAALKSKDPDASAEQMRSHVAKALEGVIHNIAFSTD
jgi:DNA-binding GntR family transcriptional regulator